MAAAYTVYTCAPPHDKNHTHRLAKAFADERAAAVASRWWPCAPKVREYAPDAVVVSLCSWLVSKSPLTADGWRARRAREMWSMSRRAHSRRCAEIEAPCERHGTREQPRAESDKTWRRGSREMRPGTRGTGIGIAWRAGKGGGMGGAYQTMKTVAVGMCSAHSTTNHAINCAHHRCLKSPASTHISTHKKLARETCQRAGIRGIAQARVAPRAQSRRRGMGGVPKRSSATAGGLPTRFKNRIGLSRDIQTVSLTETCRWIALHAYRLCLNFSGDSRVPWRFDSSPRGRPRSIRCPSCRANGVHSARAASRQPCVPIPALTSCANSCLSNIVAQIYTVGGNRQAEGKGMAVQCDLSKPEQMGERVVSKLDRMYVLVNNAYALYPLGVELVGGREASITSVCAASSC